MYIPRKFSDMKKIYDGTNVKLFISENRMLYRVRMINGMVTTSGYGMSSSLYEKLERDGVAVPKLKFQKYDSRTVSYYINGYVMGAGGMINYPREMKMSDLMCPEYDDNFLYHHAWIMNENEIIPLKSFFDKYELADEYPHLHRLFAMNEPIPNIVFASYVSKWKIEYDDDL